MYNNYMKTYGSYNIDSKYAHVTVSHHLPRIMSTLICFWFPTYVFLRVSANWTSW